MVMEQKIQEPRNKIQRKKAKKDPKKTKERRQKFKLGATTPDSELQSPDSSGEAKLRHDAEPSK